MSTPAQQLGVCSASPLEHNCFRLDFSVHIEAPPARVFEALTAEVGRWWPHTYSDTPHSIMLEPQVGGRFMELFDEGGSGVLYGLVEVYEPPQTLRVRGAVGMQAAVNVVFTITLTPDGEGTLLRELCSVSGEVTERLREGMRRGTEVEYNDHLRAWVERGEALR